MSTPTVVTVLDEQGFAAGWSRLGRVPPEHRLAPITDRATLRFTDAAHLADALVGAQVLFVHDFASPAVPGAWHAADDLRWMHVAAAGVDAQLSDAVRASDVVVTNSRGVFDGPIAEYVLAQLLSFTKDLPRSWELQRAHTWQHRESERLAGSAALVVGTGAIGRAIARLLRAVGVAVTGAGRRARDADPDFGRVVATDDAAFGTALGAADWVVAVAPLTEQTRGLFDAAAFAAMRPGARFVNVGRGELVDTDALVAALASEHLGGAALDVTDPEPLPAGHALWDLPTARITPHNSGDFHRWRDALTDLFVRNFDRWWRGEPLLNVVDTALGYVPSPEGER